MNNENTLPQDLPAELWFYMDIQPDIPVQRGPVPESFLRERAASGRLPKDTPVWRVGMDAWQPLNAVVEIEEPEPIEQREILSPNAVAKRAFGATVAFLLMSLGIGLLGRLITINAEHEKMLPDWPGFFVGSLVWFTLLGLLIPGGSWVLKWCMNRFICGRTIVPDPLPWHRPFLWGAVAWVLVATVGAFVGFAGAFFWTKYGKGFGIAAGTSALLASVAGILWIVAVFMEWKKNGPDSRPHGKKQQVMPESEPDSSGDTRFGVICLGVILILTVVGMVLSTGGQNPGRSTVPDPEALFDAAWSEYKKENFPESFRLHLKAAEAGVAQAQFNVAYFYAQGVGTAKNQDEALRWYLAAAHQGLGIAQQELAAIYYQGRGVFKDHVKARKWAQAAIWTARADGTNPYIAAEVLGKLLLSGSGGMTDIDAGRKLLEWAAISGSGEAACALGEHYFPFDQPESYAWFLISVERGGPKSFRLSNPHRHWHSAGIELGNQRADSIRQQIRQKPQFRDVFPLDIK